MFCATDNGCTETELSRKGAERNEEGSLKLVDRHAVDREAARGGEKKVERGECSD